MKIIFIGTYIHAHMCTCAHGCVHIGDEDYHSDAGNMLMHNSSV